MRVSEAFAPFINYCQSERHVADSTLDKYHECLRCWLLPWLGERDLGTVSRMDVLALRQGMVDRGLSIARQYSVIMSLKSLLKFARSTLGVSCLDPGQIALPRRPQPRVEYLTDPEIQSVLDAININTFSGIRLRALVELLLSTGMRISEALSLARDIFEQGRADAEIVGKGKRRRDVFFSPRCRYWVREYLGRRVDDYPALFVTTGFPVRRFRREDVHRFFANLRLKAGIQKRLTPHILRHTYCTILRNNGADISHIRDLAGHQSIQTTARYYLGRDKDVLRQVVDSCLRYGTADRATPVSPNGRFDRIASPG